MSNGSVFTSSKGHVSVLSVDLDYVTEELKLKAQAELFEDEEKVAKSLKTLRALLKEENDLRWQDDDLFLLAFLRAKKFDVRRAFSLVKGLYTTFGRYGDLYYGLSFNNLRRVMEANTITFLPYRDAEGSVIILGRFTGWDPHATPAEELLVCVTFGFLQALTSPSTQIAGFQFIMDFRDFGLKHLLKVDPSILKFFSEIVQNTVPVRLRGLHAVNENNFFSYIWSLIKRFMSKKLRERIHVHGSDIGGLHKFFQPSMLPADLGGELSASDNSDWRERMQASADYIEHVRSFGYEKYLGKDWIK